jgi:hypothetical protein
MRHIQGFDTTWYRFLSGWQNAISTLYITDI